MCAWEVKLTVHRRQISRGRFGDSERLLAFVADQTSQRSLTSHIPEKPVKKTLHCDLFSFFLLCAACLEEYLDDSSSDGKFRELHSTEDLNFLVEELLNVAQ